MPTASGILCATYTPQEEPDTVNSTDFSAELFCKVDDAITERAAPFPSHPLHHRSRNYRHSLRRQRRQPARFLSLAPGQLRLPVPPIAGTHPPVSPLAYATILDWTFHGRSHPKMGIADRYGIELRHPIRHGRRAGQIGRKGISNHRWIAGGKLCAVVNQFGLICD